MRKILTCIILFLFPAPIGKLLLFWHKGVHISKGARIGFCLILADSISLGSGAKVDHLSFINCRNLVLDKGARISVFVIIKGIFDIKMGEDSDIHRNAMITNSLSIPQLKAAYSVPTLSIGYNSIIGVKHFLDMTRGIQIGENSILAGRTSQLWTHSFYHQETGPGRYMIGAPIEIGDNCYIGSAVIICPGVSIVNGVTVGAGAVIGKSIERAGCYVGQPNRFFEFHPDDAILRYKKVGDGCYEKAL